MKGSSIMFAGPAAAMPGAAAPAKHRRDLAAGGHAVTATRRRPRRPTVTPAASDAGLRPTGLVVPVTVITVTE